MSERPAILGVVLVRNEDLFLPRALANAAAFCDRFLLFDNESRDATHRILSEFAASHPDATVATLSHARDSHRALEPFAGTKTWVFGLDGDEIYDPRGLAILRSRLLAGEFDETWMLMGHCLHTERLENRRAWGYMAPPSRSITKLYNFSGIESWTGAPEERLHGGQPAFRRGFSAETKRLLYQESPWESSPFRCLHTCFLRRSSLDPDSPDPRPNIDEISRNKRRAPAVLRALLRRKSPPGWKHERYRRGPLTEIDAAAFI